MNKKSTKRALLTSVLSLVLCLSMLIGTTFAWFTDSVTSSNNIIKSGRLDVALEHKDMDETTYEDASKGAIFDYQLWEPGYVQVKNIKISNLGNLAFKYQVNIFSDVKPAAGEVNLADVIDVYAFEGERTDLTRADFTDANKVGNLTSFMDGTDPDGAAYGVLLPKDGVGSTDVAAYNAPKGEVVMTIALKMQESAGNEYQNLSVGDGFTVQLLATQFTWEKDGFDEKYDANLELLDEGDILGEENGIQYIYHTDGTRTLYLVTNKYTDSKVVVPEGVVALGNYSFYYNSNVKEVELSSTVRDLGRAFDSSAVESVTLNEGLTTISNRAFKNASALKEVVIPSTVMTIEESAFQSAGLVEVVIPESVTSIEKAAFGYLPLLEKVTIKGDDVMIANYAFRACPSLKTVNLLGVDVAFGGTSMAFSRAESGVSEGLTITVANEAIKERLTTAQGSVTKYTVVCLMDSAVGGLYTDGTNYYAYDIEGFKTALANGVDVRLGRGKYRMPSSQTTANIKITGTTATVIDNTWGSYLESTTLTFEGVTIEGSTGYVTSNGKNYGADYAALYSKNVTYNNCDFVGPFRIGRDGATFNNCTFDKLGNDYVWTYGNDATFKDCTFNSEGKALLIYKDGGMEVSTVSVIGCVFNATKGAKAGAIANQNCAAIEIDNCGCGVNLTASDNTVDSDFSGEWRIKSYSSSKATVIVNGTTYSSIAIDGSVMEIDANKNVTIK